MIGSIISAAAPIVGSIIGGSSGPSTGQIAGAADPFYGQYQQYQPMLANLVANPSSVTSLPGYQFQFGQGVDAINRAAGAGGLLGSGKQLADLTSFGQGLASNFYQQDLSNLMKLSGLGAGSPATAANALQTAGMSSSALGGQLGSLVGNLPWGNIFGSGGGSAASNVAQAFGAQPTISMGSGGYQALSDVSQYLPAMG